MSKYTIQPEEKFGYFMIAIVVIGLLIVCASLPLSWVMESRTYNKLTGAHTTWFDAIWVELRVQDNPRK